MNIAEIAAAVFVGVSIAVAASVEIWRRQRRQRPAEHGLTAARPHSRIGDLVDDAEAASEGLALAVASIAAALDHGLRPQSTDMPALRERLNEAVAATGRLADAVDESNFTEQSTGDVAVLAAQGRGAVAVDGRGWAWESDGRGAWTCDGRELVASSVELLAQYGPVRVIVPVRL